MTVTAHVKSSNSGTWTVIVAEPAFKPLIRPLATETVSASLLSQVIPSGNLAPAGVGTTDNVFSWFRANSTSDSLKATLSSSISGFSTLIKVHPLLNSGVLLL